MYTMDGDQFDAIGVGPNDNTGSNRIRIDPSWTADEVQRRVLKEEHDVFPEVVAALCDDRIEFREEDGVGVIVDARLGSDGKRRCY